MQKYTFPSHLVRVIDPDSWYKYLIFPVALWKYIYVFNIVFNITINVFTSMRTKILRWFICLTRDQIIVIYGKAYIIIYTSLNDKRVHAMQPETMLICRETATVVMLLCNLHQFVLS